MAKLARLPTADGATDATKVRAPRLRTRYYAFLSYSHRDKELADWLHRELEKFRVPNSLAGKLTANGVVPKRLAPVFRDQQDLSAGGDLAQEIKAALAGSQFLIVLCSPTAATSRWTNQEIESFKRTRPEGCVLAAVVAGEPFASDVPGHEKEECFPPALRYKYDRRGHQTAKRAEPLAADFRESGEGQRVAFLKLVAGMLGVGLDELVQRDTTRRHRRMAWLAAASLGGMAVTSTLAVTAFQARNEAREQRREAEGLIGFMLGDLKAKLEPVGKLDALDGVGSRVLAYYSKIGTKDLSDAALAQRSQALSLMAGVASARGDINGSTKLYREAMAGTAEAVARSPDDANALFEHAQNVFYYGQIAHEQGDFRTAEQSMREYKRLAFKMVALQPDSMKYRMEEQYAETNLGVVLSDLRRFSEATAQFRRALATMEAVATADPRNTGYQQSVAESLAWLSDAEAATGNYQAAVAQRRRQIEILDRLAAATGDVSYQQRLIPAHRQLGRLLIDQGEMQSATEQLRTAVALSDVLIPKEPANAVWKEYAYRARIDLAWALLALGRTDEAATENQRACQLVAELNRRVPVKYVWKQGASYCLMVQARIASDRGDALASLKAAQGAAQILQTVRSGDAVNDAYLRANAWRLIGDAQRQSANMSAATAAWSTGLQQLPADVAEQPFEMSVRAQLLKRLGRNGEAATAEMRLRSIGFRSAA
ncbi:toll/interleukin-1 receptor domain-containing protein [Sphingomonas flavescens]|uniref:toll/interleukin-1 receptor domain-containing protein n=1 Tax=Sphingomonas flavescens TaxID=3132797 RepID=UPI0028057235|nr:toll/interleukin-1 receptor domain-containing protein [Sphingomonas limnosediminicola]